MRKMILTNFFLFLAVLFVACKKDITSQSQNEKQQLSLNTKKATSASNLALSSCRQELQPDWYADTIDVATQLGYTLVGNPYSVAVMQQAAINLYGSNQGIVANRKYIRYRPSTLNQLDSLVNTDIELFDYPQPGISETEIPWFYSVVDINYQPLSGIQYGELAQVYVPDNDINLENEAFRITGNPVASLNCDTTSPSSFSTTQSITPFCVACGGGSGCSISGPARVDPGSVYTYYLNCGDGSLAYSWSVSCGTTNEWTTNEIIVRWNSSGCTTGTITAYREDGTVLATLPVTIGTPPPPPPPPSKQPTGQILVRDFINGTFRDVAVRRTRVVLRRFFKVDRVYTDEQGYFYSTKHFHNKVNVFVKFKSTQLTTRGLRGARAWQALFPIKHGLGKYSGDLRNINKIFESSQMGNARSNCNWWAAQIMNAYIEFNENATALNFGTLPSDMRILLTAWQGAGGIGSAPMNHHRDVFSVSDAHIQQFLVRPGSAWWGQVYNNVYNNNVIPRGMDMSLGYNTRFAWASDKVKQLMYHELGHASHFNKVGQSWWNDFVYAESYEIARFGINGANSPYGIGDDGFLSDYISLAESWAEHVGQTIADRIYGLNSTSVFRQGITYTNNIIISGSSHINYLEDFSPFRTYDPFHWIPDGIYYDLLDDRNDLFAVPLRVNVNDAVFGYTNQQFFNALESDVKSIPAFRQRLLQQNGNNQATEVTQLFTSYNY